MFVQHNSVPPTGRLIRVLSLLGVLVWVVAGAEALGQTGESDPVGPPSRYTIFRDDELLGFEPVNSSLSFTTYQVNTSLVPTKMSAAATPWNNNSTQLVAAAGRILTPQNDQAVYARRAGAIASSATVQVGFPGLTGSLVSLPDLAPRFAGNADFLDVTAGDLDKLPDGAGNNHDEVVVVYASTAPNDQLTVNVVVLDYTSDASPLLQPVAVTTATAAQPINAESLLAPGVDEQGILPADNILAVAIGDVNGDGQNEIAVVYLVDNHNTGMAIFRYTNDGQGHRSLREVSATLDAVANRVLAGFTVSVIGTVDVAAGDVNGDGADELIVSRHLVPIDYPQDYKPTLAVFTIVQGDATLKLTIGGETTLDSLTLCILAPGCGRLQVVAGLFQFDPDDGFTLSRRQFAAVWSYLTTPGVPLGLGAAAFTVSEDLQMTQMGSTLVLSTASNGEPGQRFSIAAGGYRGNASPSDPRWSLAVNAWTADNSYLFKVLDVGPSGISDPLGGDGMAIRRCQSLTVIMPMRACRS
jgi:hypothetical protein